MTLKQTTKADTSGEYILDKSRKRIWTMKPVPLKFGGDPANFMGRAMDIMEKTKEIAWVVVDSWDLHAHEVLSQCNIQTASEAQKEKKTWAGITMGDRKQYGIVQSVMAVHLTNLLHVANRVVHVSHPYELTKKVIIGSGPDREAVDQPESLHFGFAGKALPKAAMARFSPALLYFDKASSGFGKARKTDYAVYMDDFKDSRGFAVDAKWQGFDPKIDAIKSGPVPITGLEACQGLWDLIVKARPTVNLGLYGYSNKGKTTFALTLPTKFWEQDEGTVLYLSLDPASDSLPTYWPGTVR